MAHLKNRYSLPPTPPIHSGRLADVYQAFDHIERRDVAVKLFKVGLRDDPVIREAFRRESLRLMDLRHPSLIRMLDSGEDGPEGRPYLVLEWGGDPLDKWLATGTPYRDWSDFYENVGRKILEGIAYAHSRETSHRELKPSDFLISPNDGQFRLADFGVSKFPEFLDQALDIAEFIRLNEPFSPQGGYDPARSATTDVWGYAAICLFVLTGGKLTKWDMLPEVLATLRAPDEVRQILAEALRPEAAERPPTASVLLHRLDQAHAKLVRPSAQLLCSLWLSPKARDKFRLLYPGIDTQAKIEAELLNDLQDGPPLVAAFVRNDPETQRAILEPETFVLMGRELRLVTTIDSQTKAKLVITSVSRSANAAAHERQRDDAWDCNLGFVFSSAPSSREALENLKAGHYSFVEKTSERNRQREEESLFENWSRLLQLRMNHAEEAHGYDYEGFEVEENRYTFRTTQKVDATILNETWMVEGTKLIGEVDQTDDYAVTLYVENRPSGNLPGKGRIAIDSRATAGQLKRQLHALQTIRNPRTPRQEVLKKCLIHPSDAERIPGDVGEIEWVYEDLDPNKKAIIQAALASSDLFKVEGPPGTGKTTFIAELILQFLKRNPGKRVLLTSQTHIAVDNAIERVVKFRPDLSVTRVGFQESKVAPAVQPHLLFNRLPPWREKTRKESIRFLTQFAKKSGFDATIIQQGIDVGLILQARGELARVEAREIEVEAGLLTIREQLDAKNERGEPLADVDQAAALNDERFRLRDELNDLRLAREIRVKTKRGLEKDFAKNYPQDEALLRESDDELRVWRDGLVGDSPVAKRLSALFALQSEWLQRFTRDEDSKEIILLDSALIAGTCIGVASGDIEDDGYGLCIVDEASKATLPEALVPMVRSEKWILVGDQKQLPPYVDALQRNPKMLADQRIDPAVVRETLLTRLDRLELPTYARAMLTRQHRMVPAIGNLVSAVFYEGRLESVVDPARQIPPALGSVLPAPLTWVSTSRETKRREENPRGSPFNKLEVDWAARLVENLEFYYGNSAAAKTRSIPTLKVAVLTGYSAQRALLAERMANISCRHLEVECHTVDSYQGREADIVIFSITRSNPDGRPGFLSSFERINVALSRARYALWIVGDADFCRDIGNHSPLAAVLKHIETHPGECLHKEGIR